MTVSGNPASFVVRGAAAKVNSLTVPFSPIQSLNGYSQPWPAGGGKNKYLIKNSTSTAGSGLTIECNGNATIKFSGTSDVSTWYQSYINGGSFTLPAGTYTLSAHLTGTVPTPETGNTVLVGFTSHYINVSSANPDASRTFTLSEDTSVNASAWTCAGAYNATVKVQVEAGSTSTSWEPYENHCPISGRTGLSVYVSPTQDQQDATTYAVDWTSEAGTVYGGTDEVVGGVLTDEWAEIPSYNGETITEPWLSSMDEFSPGATPTTGAQVVYKLATPLTYQLTPQEVELLVGLNNVWSDTDSVITIDYDVLSFIRQKFIVNGTDFSRFVERDSYQTSLSPVYGETVQTIDGVGHTARLRLKGALRLALNPQTDTDTAAICTELLNSPCEVIYHCLQRDADVAARMTIDTVSASFLSRCLYWGDEWNQIDPITLTEL